MDAKTYLAQCRESYPAMPTESLLAMVSCNAACSPDDKGFDPHYAFRATVCEQLVKSVHLEDRQLAQYLLKQEMLAHDADEGGVNENIRLCVYLLFKLGQVEDSLLIWRAKSINFDTLCGIDVQLLVGAGIMQTLDYLKQSDSQDSPAALKYLTECVATGDFERFDEYKEYAARYYEGA